MGKSARDGYLAPYDSWEHRRAVHRFVQDIPLTPADRAYAVVAKTAAGLGALAHVPALIVWGARDFVFDDDFLAQWHARLPTASFLRIADAGHYVLEDAFEEAGDAIAAFLARTPAPCTPPGRAATRASWSA
jgi:haloalkane dehalogenase